MKASFLFPAAAVLALLAGPVLAQGSIDTNKDGRITLAEFKAARSGLILSADSNGDGKVSPAELGVTADAIRPGRDGGRVFRILDTDNSGFLTQPEVDSAVERRFLALDTNGDGYLSATERELWKIP